MAGHGDAVPIALAVGLGIDGGWLATLAYERRLAAQGDHSTPVMAVGWSFSLVATGVLVAHAFTAEESAGAWLAVAWLPVAAKATDVTDPVKPSTEGVAPWPAPRCSNSPKSSPRSR